MKKVFGFCVAVMLVPMGAAALPTAMELALLPIELRAPGVLVEQVSCQGVLSRRTHGDDGAVTADANDLSWRSESHRESWKDGDVTFSFMKSRVGDQSGWVHETQSFRRTERSVVHTGLVIETSDVRVYSRRLGALAGEVDSAFQQQDSIVINTYLVVDGEQTLVRSVIDNREAVVPSVSSSVRTFEGGRTETRVLRAPYWSSFQEERGPNLPAEFAYVLTAKDESTCTYTVLR